MLRQQITLAHSCATKNGFNRKKSHANRSKTHAVKVEEIALKETKRQESNPLKEIVIKKRQIKQKNDIGKEESIENVFFNKLAKFQCKGGSIECSTREFMNSKDDDDIFVEVIMEIKDIAKTDERFSLHWATKTIDSEQKDQWIMAPDALKPDGTKEFGDGIASRTMFDESGRMVFKAKKKDLKNVREICAILTRGEEWLHSDEGDIKALTQDPKLIVKESNGTNSGFDASQDPSMSVLKKVCDFEAGNNRNLFSRICLLNDVLEDAKECNEKGMGLVLAWLRLSSTKQLPWYEGHNYQGKDMAHLQKVIASRLANVAAKHEDGTSRQYARMAMQFVARGGGNGDDIRLGILNIMREHGIKEGHRPGIEDPFIAQWHQKLHSNTTPDDIKICEAYLHFLHTGNWDDFWTHLWDNAKLTREDLAGMKAGWRTEGISGPACHLPQMIGSFKHYLWILKTTHGGADVDTAMGFAQGKLSDEARNGVWDIINNRNEHWIPGKIVEVRKLMLSNWKHDGEPDRDVVMLDAALEKFFRTKVEQIDFHALDQDSKLSMLELAIENVTLTGESENMQKSLDYFRRAQGEECGPRWSESWALTMKAALDNVTCAIAKDMDALCEISNTTARKIASVSKNSVSDSYLMNFGEEVVRGHALFVAAGLANASFGDARNACKNKSPWLISANGESPDLLSKCAGKVLIKNLEDAQGEDFTKQNDAIPIVFFSEKLGGLEDIPKGVSAVITKTPVDVLSHVAIRARNTGAFLASVQSDEIWEELINKKFEFVSVSKSIDGNSVEFSAVKEVEARRVLLSSSSSNKGSTATTVGDDDGTNNSISVPKPKATRKLVVFPDAYAQGVVGGKSQSLASSAKVAKAAGCVVPVSFALPFGSFEKALKKDPETKKALDQCLKIAASTVKTNDIDLRREALAMARKVVSEGLELPDDFAQELESAVAETSSSTTSENKISVDELWSSITGVWASKWTERAFNSRIAVGIKETDLSVAVLNMELCDAKYAFVLHSKDPTDESDDDIMCGEICVGLGEALVGNDPGRALGFRMNKKTKEVLEITSQPSKPVRYISPTTTTTMNNNTKKGKTCYISRSDSNGEDLENFAGAGLYDSIPTSKTIERANDYAQCELIWNVQKRDEILIKLCSLAIEIEKAHKSKAQDIEGCVLNDEAETLVLLQTRAQV
jgi:alpha-glucan, water dikinase